MNSVTVVQSQTALGKRKAPSISNNLVLHLEPNVSDYESNDSSSTLRPPIVINGKLVSRTKKRYQCTHVGCIKAYSKPSRLAEHERSHTGQRPFICEACNRSYLRDTHLQAHSRSHLPSSARPLQCEVLSCGKRFWTSQHLRVHMDWHNGTKPFKCSEQGCGEAFTKHHQLRTHICIAHAPPGTKPYPCDHDGCGKSFASNQHLRTHLKTHDASRYTCVHPSCIADVNGVLKCFPTWTSLQHHMRTDHPPSCPHPSCASRTFSTQKGLRAHQKLHEQRDQELAMGQLVAEDDDLPRKRRRGGEIGRDWKCDMDECGKEFKSKKSLVTHKNITHLGRRDFICPLSACGHTFGYKHLLQRHIAKCHESPGSDSVSSDESNFGDESIEEIYEHATLIDIDAITGNAYAERASTAVMNAKALRCPYPNLEGILPRSDDTSHNHVAVATTSHQICEYIYSRAYDLRRHLRASHNIETEKDVVDVWVKRLKHGSRMILHR